LSSELLVARDGADLLAICDPRGALGDREARLVRDAVAGRADVVACGPGTPPGCWIAGRLDDRRELAHNVGLPPDAEPEAIAAAGWARWGADVLGRMRGQFTAVFWDPERRTTTVATDHLGLLSPYVHTATGRLLVATRVELLLRLLPRRPEPDRVSLLKALSGEMAPVRSTLFDGVERVPGGDAIVVDSSGVRTVPYWRPTYRTPLALSPDEATDLVWSALRKSVRRRIQSSTSTGIVMSGGIDSTAVAAAAVAEGTRLPTYSTVFPGTPVDESARIDAVVDALDLPNTQMRVEPKGGFAAFLEYLDATGLLVPGAGYLVELPLLREAAASGVTSLLDGQGGDELFSVSGFLIADAVRRGRMPTSVRLTRRLPGAGSGSRRQLLNAWRFYVQSGAIPYVVHAPLKRRRGLRSIDDHGLLTRESQRLLVETDESLHWKRRRTAPLWWSHKAWLLTRAREGVRVADYLRTRAALVGVEAAPPLFDVDLVEAALRVPPETEFDPQLDRPLIRRATAGLVPDEVRLSKFKSNLAPFFLEASLRDRPAMVSVLDAGSLRLAPYLNVQATRDYFHNPPAQAGPEGWQWSSALWRVVTLECWLQSLDDPEWIDRMRSRLAPERPEWSVHRRREMGVGGGL
jgi:asparagine synthase (glutamine-hydrolysing)